jgi:hypothetical protein
VRVGSLLTRGKHFYDRIFLLKWEMWVHEYSLTLLLFIKMHVYVLCQKREQHVYILCQESEPHVYSMSGKWATCIYYVRIVSHVNIYYVREVRYMYILCQESESHVYTMSGKWATYIYYVRKVSHMYIYYVRKVSHMNIYYVRKVSHMYLCVRSIDFVSFYDVSIIIWNCSEVWYFLFIINQSGFNLLNNKNNHHIGSLNVFFYIIWLFCNSLLKMNQNIW